MLRELHARAGGAVCVSVTSLDAALLRRLEPGTPPPLRRLETVRRLVEAGIPAGVMAMPLLPGIADEADALAALAAAARACGACFFMAGALRLGPNLAPWFSPFLRSERPDLVPLYRRLYPTGYAPRPYVEQLHATVASLRADFGLPAAPAPLLPAREPAQLALAWESRQPRLPVSGSTYHSGMDRCPVWHEMGVGDAHTMGIRVDHATTLSCRRWVEMARRPPLPPLLAL